MNKVDFSFQGGFPFDTNTLDFLQSAYSTGINALTALGGSSADNYIVSGCVVTGSSVSPGWMVIAGELLPFEGGILQSKVIVRETKTPVKFQDQIDRDVIIERYVAFGSGAGEIQFSSIATIKNLLTVKAELAAIQLAIAAVVSVPSGVIVAWFGSIVNIPAGWKLCDGTAGTPNLYHKFIRGTTIQAEIFGTGGVENVTLTEAQIPAHSHLMNLAENGAGNDHLYAAVTDNHNILKETGTTLNTGGGESHTNMPPYYTLAYIIKS